MFKIGNNNSTMDRHTFASFCSSVDESELSELDLFDLNFFDSVSYKETSSSLESISDLALYDRFEKRNEDVKVTDSNCELKSLPVEGNTTPPSVGAKRKRNAITLEQKDEIVSMRASGVPRSEIANIFNIPPATVKNIVYRVRKSGNGDRLDRKRCRVRLMKNEKVDGEKTSV